MLKKIYRLSVLKRDKSEKTIPSSSFTLKYLINGDDVSRFAFIISKKIDKKAVIRNKIKRNISKVLEESLSEIVTGHNFIFIPKKEILTKSVEDIKKEIKDVFKQNKLLK